MIADMVQRSAERMGIPLPKGAPEQFAIYFDMLMAANARMNLTRIVEPEAVVAKHFMDSLTLIKTGVLPNAATLADVGSGAGLPGIALMIALPDIRAILFDSLGKRVGFLNEVISALKLRGEAVHARAEDAARQGMYREAFDCVTARAVAELRVLCELTLPLLRVGGVMAAYKGPGVDSELSGARHVISLLGGELRGVESVCIPGEAADHRLVLIHKRAPSPARFPRKAGEPARSPL